MRGRGRVDRDDHGCAVVAGSIGMANGADSQPSALTGILSGGATVANRAVSAAPISAVAAVGKHGSTAGGISGWADAGEGRALVPDGADTSAPEMGAGPAVAVGNCGMLRGHAAGLLGGACHTVFLLAAIPGAAGLPWNAVACVFVHGGERGSVWFAPHRKAGAAAG